jgi:cell division protein FtsI (penicillin-binding protein 3)
MSGPHGGAGRPSGESARAGGIGDRLWTARTATSGDARLGPPATGAARTGTPSTAAARTGTPRTRTAGTGTAGTGTAGTGTARTGTARTGTARTGISKAAARSSGGSTRVPVRGITASGRRPPRRVPARRPRGPRRTADPDRRLGAALIGLVFVLTLFAGRLVQMQGLDGPAVASKALDERSSTITLPAHRGDITDVDGVPLAQTWDRSNVLVDQTLVPLYKRIGPDGRRVVVGVPGAAEDLARVLDLPVAEVAAKLTGTSRGAYLARDIAPDVARQVIALPIPGVDLEAASRRVYPAGTTAANVLGFVSATTGQAFGGVEQAYDSSLAGRPGWIRYERGADGTRIPTGVTDTDEPRPGESIRLTINQDLQFRAQQLLQAQVTATGAASGDAVIMTKTGQVLALATAPSYDPNNPGQAQQANLGDRPLLDVFEPGSTAKVITMAAALEEKVATPLTRVTVPPQLKRADRTFTDAEAHGTEQLTVAGVLAQSSNIGAILTGEKLSPQTMYSYLQRFGVGARTGIGLSESSGELAPWQRWSGSQRYTVMFGQGLSVTALQAASVFATIANDGVRVEPRLVAGETGADGVFLPTPAAPATRVVSAQTAQQVRLMLESVVGENGTAVKATVPGYRVAGKTGTAQAYAASCGCYQGYTASFIGMAPADDPALVIAVVLQNPVNGHFGGEVAAPVFQQLMTYALAERKVPPTGTKPPEIPLTWR